MKFPKGSLVYYTKNLNQYRLLTEFHSDDYAQKGWVLAENVDNKEDRGYLPGEQLYYNLESAKKRKKLDKEIYDLRGADIAQKITDEWFAEKDKE